MPVVVLLDNSLSMRRRGSTEESSRSLLSLAVKGLDSFFAYMGRCFPLEYCSLLSFSSTCKTVSPFTRDHDELRRMLLTVTTQDRSDVIGSLYAMAELVIAEWGSFAPCQVVLVTDGRVSPPSSHPSKSLPFPCKFHVVCLSKKAETTRLQSLCELLLPITSVTYPSSPLMESSVIDGFVSLIEAHFRPYTGVLKCAHMQSTVCLSPTPEMAHVQSDYKFVVGNSVVEFSSPKIQPFPEELNICGFLDITSISAPAVLSRHFVLDAAMDNEYLAKVCEQLRDQKELSSLSEAGSRTSQFSEKPSFRVILHGSLKCESKLALVKLSESWYGLLSSAAATSKKSNLILSVLQPNAPVPWLGPFQYLGPKPVMADSRSSAKTGFPVSVHHTLSYQSSAHLYWVKGTGLQTDIGKISRYIKKLPEKEISLVKELNKVRSEALTYNFPSLLDAVCKILAAEEVSCTPTVRPMLHNYIQFLSTNNNPQEKLATLAQQTK